MGAFGAGNLRREGLTVGPDGAILEVLLLPDGHSPLQRIDEPTAGVEGGRAMRRGYHDQHAGLTDFQPAEAMNYGDIANLGTGKRLLGQLLQLLDRHLFVGFVVNIESAAPATVVAHDTLENHGCTILGLL